MDTIVAYNISMTLYGWFRGVGIMLINQHVFHRFTHIAWHVHSFPAYVWETRRAPRSTTYLFDASKWVWTGRHETLGATRDREHSSSPTTDAARRQRELFTQQRKQRDLVYAATRHANFFRSLAGRPSGHRPWLVIALNTNGYVEGVPMTAHCNMESGVFLMERSGQSPAHRMK